MSESSIARPLGQCGIPAPFGSDPQGRGHRLFLQHTNETPTLSTLRILQAYFRAIGLSKRCNLNAMIAAGEIDESRTIRVKKSARQCPPRRRAAVLLDRTTEHYQKLHYLELINVRLSDSRIPESGNRSAGAEKSATKSLRRDSTRAGKKPTRQDRPTTSK